MVTTNGQGRLRLPDGRRVDTWVGGEPSGWPVLFFHGTPGGRLQAALADGAAVRSGARLVAFSRPGYGGSTDAPTTLRSVAHDALTVADLLGLGAFATLGTSGGGPFALACAAVAPDRVVRVGVVAGVGPTALLDPAVAEHPATRLALAGRADAALAATDSELEPVWAGAATGDLARRSRPGTPISPEILEPWTASGRPGVPSYRGASRDFLALAGWALDLSAVTCPVHLWYGDRDRHVPPAHGQWLHGQLPTSTLVIREGAGHLGTLMPYWREILTTLTRPTPR